MSESIIVEHVSYSYPDGSLALDDVSFVVQQGEAVALVGPSGAGKSTLLLCLSGFLFPQKGEIYIAGFKLTKKNVREIRKKVGLIFQNPDDQLFMPTLYDDVAFGLINRGVDGDELDRRVRKAIEERGLKGLEKKFPGHLSGGQKRLASLATVLVMEPEILLTDEPSSNLDPKSRRDLINNLASLNNTRIIASHDLEMALDLCRRAILLDRGKIAKDGDAVTIMSDEKLMEEHNLEVPHSLLPHRFEQHSHRCESPEKQR